MSSQVLDLCSISWIDSQNLPEIGYGFMAGALFSWPKKVVIGLVGTANPPPPRNLSSDLKTFTAKQHYRALLACEVNIGPPTSLADKGTTVDAGWTPPVDLRKLPMGAGLGIPNDSKFYPGESSPVSSVVTDRLHPASTLKVPTGGKVIVSSLIKFRAGDHTDKVGIKEAGSPMHVPWVWCEYALVSVNGSYQLLCNGSQFPSHAWYVNGKQVAKRLQEPVTASERDPAISTGPKKGAKPSAASDKAQGAIDKHPYAVGTGKPITVKLTSQHLVRAEP